MGVQAEQEVEIRRHGVAGRESRLFHEDRKAWLPQAKGVVDLHAYEVVRFIEPVGPGGPNHRQDDVCFAERFVDGFCEVDSGANRVHIDEYAAPPELVDHPIAKAVDKFCVVGSPIRHEHPRRPSGICCRDPLSRHSATVPSANVANAGSRPFSHRWQRTELTRCTTAKLATVARSRVCSIWFAGSSRLGVGVVEG